MAKSAIEWLWMPGYQGESWNFITGCTKISPGCAKCYAEAFAKRFNRNGGSYLPGEAVIQYEPQRINDPANWRTARMVFMNSVSDVFHEEIENRIIDLALGIVAMYPRHIFLALTKRTQRMADYFADPTVRVRIQDAMRRRGCLAELRWPIPNLWLGTSVENQHFANERIPLMRDLPTPVRFLSVEPLIGPIDFDGLLDRHDSQGRNVTGLNGLHQENDTTNIDWMIIGGESGPKARPMHPLWLTNAVEAAESIGIPVFFKQWGHYRPYNDLDDDANPKVISVRFNRIWQPGDPPNWLMTPVGKGAAGHSLALAGYWEDERREWPEYGLRYR